MLKPYEREEILFDILLRLLNIAFCAVLLFGPTYASAGLYPTLGYIANDGREPTILYALPLATSAQRPVIALLPKATSAQQPHMGMHGVVGDLSALVVKLLLIL